MGINITVYFVSSANSTPVEGCYQIFSNYEKEASWTSVNAELEQIFNLLLVQRVLHEDNGLTLEE